MSVLVIYHSKTGITKKYAEEIASYILDKGQQVIVKSFADVDEKEISASDKIIMGCWTSGLFLFAQHPEKEWVNLSDKITSSPKRAILFTTYKLATGSMFRNMEKYLVPKGFQIESALKSKNGLLSESNKERLNEFIEK
jgi:flavodoxin